MTDIDWEFQKTQINAIYWLQDKQIEEGLQSLCSAQKLYDNMGSDIPQCIMLFDRNDTMVHKIITCDGKPLTVKIRPPDNVKKIMFTIGIIGLIGLSAISAYYYLKMTH